MIMRSLTLSFACLLATSGCRFGPTVDTFEPARSPAGVEMDVQTDDPGNLRRFRGELLAAHDTALVLATREGVVIVPMSGIRRAWPTSNRNVVLARRAGPPRVMEALRRMSRYPQGVSPELLRDLLAAYHQTEPVRPR